MTDNNTTMNPDVAELLCRSAMAETAEACIRRLEQENACSRAQAEATFREQHAQNMLLVAKIDALRNENGHLTTALKVARTRVADLEDTAAPISRRVLLGGVTATSITGPASAEPDPDTELRRLVAAWFAADGDMQAAYDAPDVPRSPAFMGAMERRGEIEDLIITTPALTLAGIAAKSRIIDHGGVGTPYVRLYDLARAVACDVAVLAGAL